MYRLVCKTHFLLYDYIFFVVTNITFKQITILRNVKIKLPVLLSRLFKLRVIVDEFSLYSAAKKEM